MLNVVPADSWQASNFMTLTKPVLPSAEETAFLEWLNRNLPPGVDWKQGALDYIAARLAEEQGEITRRFCLTKPFYSVSGDQPINQQAYEFTREISHFLNVLSLLQVAPQTRFLDVACGSGWWTHFLAKLSLTVVGIDISPDMLALTEERLRLDGIATLESDTFDRVKLLLHDMEAAPLPTDLRCGVAVLESALHHFVNPIQTLRNIAASLDDDGLIVILELSSDGHGDPNYYEVMERYDTLERPYTRDQLLAILQFAGLAEYQFFYPMNGFFPPTAEVGNRVRDLIVHDPIWNIVIAAKRPGVLAKSLSLGTNFPGMTIVPTALAAPTPVAPIAAPAPAGMALSADPAGMGLRGELQILKATSQRIVQKAIAKVRGR
jgi:SAM-dependent methyltransferase